MESRKGLLLLVYGLIVSPTVSWSWSNLLMTSTRANLGLVDISTGVELAMDECQQQFRWERWGCPKSSFNRRNALRALTKETGFVHAILAAGVTFSLTKNCSRGNVEGCTCARQSEQKPVAGVSWKWGGCSDNIQMGEELSSKVLDNLETGQDSQAFANLHNNRAGRKAVSRSMKKSCKCHGVSGSCAMQTCWMQLSEFHAVGTAIKLEYDSAIKVEYTNGILQANPSALENSSKLEGIPVHRLVYLEDSPDYCRTNTTAGVSGTLGRICSRDTGASISAAQRRSCPVLCKSCGHKVRRRTVKVKSNCNCTFQWCCHVKCQTCVNKVTEFVCI